MTRTMPGLYSYADIEPSLCFHDYDDYDILNVVTILFCTESTMEDQTAVGIVALWATGIKSEPVVNQESILATTN